MPDYVVMSGARLLFSPVGTALPSDHTVAYGAAASLWPTGWKDCGLTNKPAALNYQTTDYKLMTQQSTVPYKKIVTEEQSPLEVGLIQLNSDNLKLAFPGAAVEEVAADGTHKGVTIVKYGGIAVRPTWQWCLEGAFVDDANNLQPFRSYMYKGQAALSGSLELALNKEAALNLTIDALVDPTKDSGAQVGELHFVHSPMTA